MYWDGEFNKKFLLLQFLPFFCSVFGRAGADFRK